MGAASCGIVRGGPHLEYQPACPPVPVVLLGGVSRSAGQRVGQREANSFDSLDAFSF